MTHDPDDIPGELERIARRIRSGEIATKAVVVVVGLRDRPEVFALGHGNGAVKAAGLLSLGTEVLTT